jgi:hypothetical protein
MPYPLSVTNIEAEITAIGANPAYAGFVTVSNLPNVTIEGRTVKLIRIGTGSIHVLILGGVHAREWAPPDAVLDWVKNLLEAKRLGTAFIDPAFNWVVSNADVDDGVYTGPITFDRATIIDAPTVKRIIKKLSIFVIPCVNPDGRNFTAPTFPLGPNVNWRKNRNPLGVACGEMGVDINRNFPMCWDYRTYYNSASASSSGVSVLDNPCGGSGGMDPDQVYHGTGAASEPETRNVISVLTNHNIRFFIDVHSHQRDIYYAWGINPNQNSDPSKTFLNTALNSSGGIGGREVGNIASYGEYIPGASFETNYILCANAMRQAIYNNAGADVHARARSKYQVKQSFALYSAPGSSDDYAFSTQLTASGNNASTNSKFPLYAFTIEVGEKFAAEGRFQPSLVQYPKIRREVWSALAALTGFAANWRASSITAPPPPAQSDEPCFIATVVFQNPHHHKVVFLRHFRDWDMRQNNITGFIMNKVNKVYNKYGPIAAIYAKDKPLLKSSIKWFFLEPIIFIMQTFKTICSYSPFNINYTMVLLLILISSVFYSFYYIIYLITQIFN